MTPVEIKHLDERYRATAWSNNKTGEPYYVLDIAMDATNDREGSPVVIYQNSSICRGTVFVRDFQEFTEKFTKKG